MDPYNNQLGQNPTPIADIDWFVDRDEKVQFVKMMQKEYHRDFRKGNPAAEWRLRCKRQANIVNELSKLGNLAKLMCGPMLSTYRSGSVIPLERFSSWRDTLDSSPLMYHMNAVQRAQVFGLKPESWTRLEGAIHSLGHCLCLAVKDLDDPSLLEASNSLKIALIKRALGSDRNLDSAISYIKWLGKSCQFALLRAPCPESPDSEYITDSEGTLLPFVGQWSFVSNLILTRQRRKFSITTYQARFLAQMGNEPRSLPHPSLEQAKADVNSTVGAFTSEYHPSKEALDKYRHGIVSILGDVDQTPPTHSHVSLVSSGKLDASRTQGGGAAILVSHTRKYTDTVLTEQVLTDLTDKYDQFGRYLIDPLTMIIAKKLLGYGEGCKPQAYTCTATIGDILYIKPNEIESVWQQTLNSKQRVPVKLAELLTLTSSKLILSLGSYNNEHEVIHGVLTFKTKNNVFYPNKTIPVKAGISIEAGLKSRVTTSGWAAFAHLSQLPSNYMRGILSRDPFVRIGFQEQEKFWEVLKIYKTRCERSQQRND
jgi:hypothetical protein